MNALKAITLLFAAGIWVHADARPTDYFSATDPLFGSSFGIPGNQTFDYVIVGGGTAGLALANRLSQNHAWTVAVVEAGGFPEIENGNVSQIPIYGASGSDKGTANFNPAVDWGFVTVSQKEINNSRVHYARGKCLGGSSARNYMAYQRGSVDSYNQWASLVGDESYRWSSFLPYLQKSVSFHAPDPLKRAANATPQYDLRSIGQKGEVSLTFSNYAQAISSWVQKGLAEMGIRPVAGFTSGRLLGSSYVLQTIQKSQVRETSETAFLAPAQQRGNLIVFTHSMAKKILFDSEKTATSVLVDTAGKTYTISARREIVLSAGAFQSPQLLMVSGVGPKPTLDKFGISVVADRPGVGQNMWDHVFFGPSYRVKVITSSALNDREFASRAAIDFNKRQAGIMTNSGGDFFAWEKLPAASRASFPKAVKKSLDRFPADWPEVEYLTVAGFLGDNYDYVRSTPKDSYNYASVVAAIVAPLSRGTVSISSADAADPPVIDPHWLEDPADQAVAIAAYRRIRQLFKTKAMSAVLIGPEYYPGITHGRPQSDAELLSKIKRDFNTVWHASCTCKMGRSNDPMAVVDSRARVIGTNKLRVVDASAFAILPPGHPVSTIYGLVEKIAEDIKKN
ncbi:GMC oxidoreductase [Aplosporella prunicola CBS 121167]|uniref:GMC oxidoreductase n=1 Tax=Aplosporella prunicola CBS 121167 TaxID=1176127 RepID=A0A6A6B282_9PEZI|nr:GMC oxidoreductase [Aplosporella prunicola CBS 121167]KAF2137127.1 GMC oxidoreductase [Aplosporella prunicola CBS 121167]